MARLGNTVLPRTRYSCTLKCCCAPAAAGGGGAAVAAAPHAKAAITASGFRVTISCRLDIGPGISGSYPQTKNRPLDRRGRRFRRIPITFLGLGPDQFVFTG